MRDFLKAETYYVVKDPTFRGISVVLLLGSALLLFWMGTQVGFGIDSPLEPLITSVQLSFFLYFIIPVYVCFFTTEGFEQGSVQNIIASGQSRSLYILGKYLTGLKIILCWVLQFFGLFYALYILAAIVTGSHIGNENLGIKFIAALGAIGFNILYLAAYSAVVLMFGVLMKKTASAIVATFVYIFGDFLLSGYLKDSPSVYLRMISDHTLTTQIFKFSAVKKLLLFDLNDYIQVTLIPVILIVICLIVALVIFEKRDIHL